MTDTQLTQEDIERIERERAKWDERATEYMGDFESASLQDFLGDVAELVALARSGLARHEPEQLARIQFEALWRDMDKSHEVPPEYLNRLSDLIDEYLSLSALAAAPASSSPIGGVSDEMRGALGFAIAILAADTDIEAVSVWKQNTAERIMAAATFRAALSSEPAK